MRWDNISKLSSDPRGTPCAAPTGAICINFNKLQSNGSGFISLITAQLSHPTWPCNDDCSDDVGHVHLLMCNQDHVINRRKFKSATTVKDGTL